MKTKKHFFRKFLRFCVVSIIFVLVFSVAYFFAVTKDTTLDTNKIENSFAKNVAMFDNFDTKIDNCFGDNMCKYSELSQHTIDAFVAVEDKRFFEHHGIDFIRVVGAIKNNILNPKHKQGGSTITQQVVKNVQLDSSRTIDRKLKEMKLAVQMEKNYSKEQIMELYLNSIYFGNGCYGIENASNYYFDKPAKDLSIAESALLASVINAPRIYNPVENFDKANTRKNLVLDLMKNSGKIDEQQYVNAKEQEIVVEKNKSKYFNQYFDAAVAEACKILHTTENQLGNMNVKINTYFDKKIQEKMQEQIFEYYGSFKDVQIGSIAIDNKEHAVVALASNKKQNLLNISRQPGSIIKPILVYAPAFESKKYSPATFVEDKPINIGGYSPENANKQYLGVVNVRDSISKSINTVAVEVLDNIGIKYAKNFASGFGITFDNNDNNLALALGGFTKGLNIMQIANAYSCFANGGQYSGCSCIKSIYVDGKQVYQNQNFLHRACKDSTAFLINNCLIETAKSGTAKRLGTYTFDVCSKTGTVGDTHGNTDAYNVAYTTDHTFCTWFGSTNNNKPMSTNINGATYPTLFNKTLLSSTYSSQKPSNFEMPSSIKKVALGSEALSEQKLEIDQTSNVFDYFDIDTFLPETSAEKLNINIVVENFENSKPIIKFDAKRSIIYQICRFDGSNLQILSEIQFKDELVSFEDKTAVAGKIYEYYVLSNHKNKASESNHIKLIAN